MSAEEILIRLEKMSEEIEKLKARRRSRSGSREKDVKKDKNTGEDGSNSEDTLSNILKTYSDAIKGLTRKVITKDDEDPQLTSIVNSLSKTRVSRAVDGVKGTKKKTSNSMFVAEPLNPPNLVSESEKADPQVLRENLASLKDLFKTALTGSGNEDFIGYLSTTTDLVNSSNLSQSQFYLLLRSRIVPGTPLFVDVNHHYQNKTPIAELFEELVPLYGEKNNYLTNLQKLEEFTSVPANMSPMEVLSKIKSFVTDLAYCTEMDREERKFFIFRMVRNKVLSLYPTLSPFIIKEESQENKHNLGEFTRLFNKLSPMAISKKKGSGINEMRDFERESVFKIYQVPQ